MGTTAFELRKEYAGKVKIEGEDGRQQNVDVFDGAVIGVPPEGASFDVKEQLRKGSGKIVLDSVHANIADALRNVPALKEVAAGDAKPIDGYEFMSTAALVERAQARDIDGAGGK